MYSREKNNSIAFASICNEQLMEATVLDIFKEHWFVDLPKDTQNLIVFYLGRRANVLDIFKEPWFENLPQKTRVLIIFKLGKLGQKTVTENHVTEEIAGADHNEPQFPDADHNEPQFPDADHNEPQFPDADYNEQQFPDADHNELQFPDADHNEPQYPDAEHNAEEFSNEEDVVEEQFQKGETELDNVDGPETSFIGSNLDSFERSVRVLSCSPKASLNENSYQINSTKNEEVLLDNPESINNWKNLYYSDSSEDEEDLQQDNKSHSNVSLGSLANLTILSSNSETSMQQKFKKFSKSNKKRATTTRPKRATKNHYEISDGSDFCDETSKTVQSRKTSEKGNGERVSAFISNPFGKKQTVFGTIVNEVSIN